MVFLRTFVLISALACVLCAGGYVFTRDRKYLQWAWRILKYTAVAALIFFAVLFAEELWFREVPR